MRRIVLLNLVILALVGMGVSACTTTGGSKWACNQKTGFCKDSYAGKTRVGIPD